MKKRQYYLF